MRMYYDAVDGADPEDEEGLRELRELTAARVLLADRVEEWAAAEGRPVEAELVRDALEYRHADTPDGRLGRWGSAEARGFLLEWLPRQRTVLPGDPLPEAPEALRALIGYVHAHELADPLAPSEAAALAAVDEAAAGYPAAMADRSRYGIAKYWVTAAAERGVDIDDEAALGAFTRRALAGEPGTGADPEEWRRVLARRAELDAAGPARVLPQPPVALPDEAALRAAAAAVPLPEWAGCPDDGAADPLRRWQQGFDALFAPEPGALLLADGERAAFPSPFPSALRENWERALPDVLSALYALPAPMPLPRLRASLAAAGEGCSAEERALLDADLVRLARGLELLGAAECAIGRADACFVEALPPLAAFDEAADADDPYRGLREELERGPVPLLALTPLGTHGVRLRLRAAGRIAPLVGELAAAPPAGLLGALAEHYDEESARAELSAWVAARGGPAEAVPQLVAAVGRAPFRARRAGLLAALAGALPAPDGTELLHALRADAALGPVALSALLHLDGGAVAATLSERDRRLAVAEQLLQLHEATGPDGIRALLRAENAATAREMHAALADSPHPDTEAIAALAALLTETARATAQQSRANAADTRRRHTGKRRR
ncbi:hypothetical protein BIV57_07400 [Mangrovactinospora gilvigrisea]|uniref:Uncharacterized protein n=1 Tax=Mangrovactinospora gilvigrisea TaxID=1428644 RepID=A0A1J7BHK3_9ACTN|nr:hypothetical protein [Mangrovactinospora gilvigrisea]OIV38134.1 hypothetical protein BIV57_07400 [Mangrovactinospora gilvigrisea]